MEWGEAGGRAAATAEHGGERWAGSEAWGSRSGHHLGFAEPGLPIAAFFSVATIRFAENISLSFLSVFKNGFGSMTKMKIDFS